MKNFLINCIAIVIVSFVAGVLSRLLGIEQANTIPIWFIAFMVANHHYQRKTKEDEEKRQKEQLIKDAVLKEQIRKELKVELQAEQNQTF